MPSIEAGAQCRMTSSVKAPLPQPMSSQRWPGFGGEPLQESGADELAPDAHAALVGGAVLEADGLAHAGWLMGSA